MFGNVRQRGLLDAWVRAPKGEGPRKAKASTHKSTINTKSGASLSSDAAERAREVASGRGGEDTYALVDLHVEERVLVHAGLRLQVKGTVLEVEAGLEGPAVALARVLDRLQHVVAARVEHGHDLIVAFRVRELALHRVVHHAERQVGLELALVPEPGGGRRGGEKALSER